MQRIRTSPKACYKYVYTYTLPLTCRSTSISGVNRHQYFRTILYTPNCFKAFAKFESLVIDLILWISELNDFDNVMS